MDFFDWLIFYVFVGSQGVFLEGVQKCHILCRKCRTHACRCFSVTMAACVRAVRAAGRCFAEVWGGRRPQRHKNTRSECPVPFRWRKGGRSLHWTRADAIRDPNTPILANSCDPIAVNRWPPNLKPIVAPITYAGALKRHRSL